MTQVLVVEDSQFMRTVIDNALTDAGYEVAAVASGEEAVDAVAELEPAVVTMDVEMPGMSGIEAVEHVMATNPTPVVMLSAYTERGTDATLEALERGAVDFIHKPDGSDSRNLAHLVDAIVETVGDIVDADVSPLALSRSVSAPPSTASEATASPSEPIPAPTPAAPADAANEQRTGHSDRERATEVRSDTDDAETRVDGDGPYCDDPTLVVGASTGGPRLIERILECLPLDLGAKVVVVQHMPEGFTARFADRLDAASAYEVREARDGDRVRAGEVVVARGGVHLAVTNNVGGWLRVRYDSRERVHGVRPSIDVTMQTAASRVSDPLVGVVLTGMGKDGAEGIAAIKRAGGRTIAQDEATSPVFGIPRQAIETGCVDEVVAADDLVERICDAFRTDTDGETNG
ncbi:chemotaxis-specific protein-glutamate methyltransferase CheB [Natronobiforma cellulositropha]|uniref:chemotaxis-specific protein-glutamate methyltransferase CheB n=1 Tax=Natronobiforma cellulositropha TaxID=1679076 RepID=UPI0021D56CB7|nr:chemotaxis-specific protein-glutamate methyltransferase CheB [Natronobiforma cellulositropha]